MTVRSVTQASRRDAIRMASAAATLVVCKPAITLADVVAPADDPLEMAEGLDCYYSQPLEYRKRLLRYAYRQWIWAGKMYDLDPSLRRAWDLQYGDLLDCCDWEETRADDVINDTAWQAWCREILPPKYIRSWQPWPRLTGLSRRYQWLDAAFEAELYRHADVWSDYAANARNCRHDRIEYEGSYETSTKRENAAYWDLRRVALRVLDFPATTLADRELRKRAVQIIVLDNSEYGRKYHRAKILQKIRGLPQRDIARPKAAFSSI